MTMTPPASESFVASDLVIEGKVQGEGILRVAGKVKGEVELTGSIIVEPGALVDAKVRADGVTVAHGARLRGQVDFGRE
jgi:cytoskeletal protein CcmA (bactofilin family)